MVTDRQAYVAARELSLNAKNPGTETWWEGDSSASTNTIWHLMHNQDTQLLQMYLFFVFIVTVMSLSCTDEIKTRQFPVDSVT